MRTLLIGLLIAIGMAGGLQSAAANTGPHAGSLFVLSVGICPPYRTDVHPSVCSKAAKKFAQSMEHAFNIPKSNVVVLTDEATTAANFLNELKALAARVTPQDRVILYLLGHSGSFAEWDRVSEDHLAPLAAANRGLRESHEFIMTFWTKENQTLPAVALAEGRWLTLKAVRDAIETLPAKVALIMDSCGSGDLFAGVARHARTFRNIDYVVMSAGPTQVANLNSTGTLPLFTEQLVYSLNLPTVRHFGEAVDQARSTTALASASACATTLVDPRDYPVLFPGMTEPSERTWNGKVSLPPWFCGQVPSVIDLSGTMTRVGLVRPK